MMLFYTQVQVYLEIFKTFFAETFNLQGVDFSKEMENNDE